MHRLLLYTYGQNYNNPDNYFPLLFGVFRFHFLLQ